MADTPEEKYNPSTAPGPDPEIEAPSNHSPLKQIRTFQGDVAEALASQQESLVSIQRAEHIKRGGLKISPEAAKKAGSFLTTILASALLLVLGTAGAWYAYQEFQRKTYTPISSAPANRFISVNKEIPLTFADPNRDEILKVVRASMETVQENELHHLLLQKETAESSPIILTTAEFLSALDTNTPGALVRAFDPLFMIGALGQSSFLIIKLSSFENAFPGMLAWERELPLDIGPLFSTAPLLRDIPPGSVFIDVIDRNKDIRALIFENQPILMYAFYDNSMVIITDKIETLRSVIDRLTREKLSR